MANRLTPEIAVAVDTAWGEQALGDWTRAPLGQEFYRAKEALLAGEAALGLVVDGSAAQGTAKNKPSAAMKT